MSEDLGYCKEHPTYTMYRRPSNECLSCWRLYFAAKDYTLEEYAERVSSDNPELDEWLREKYDEIMEAPIAGKASFTSEFEVISEEEAQEEESVTPAKGVKI